MMRFNTIFLIIIFFFQTSVLLAQRIDRLNEEEYDEFKSNLDRVFLYNDSILTIISDTTVFQYKLHNAEVYVPYSKQLSKFDIIIRDTASIKLLDIDEDQVVLLRTDLKIDISKSNYLKQNQWTDTHLIYYNSKELVVYNFRKNKVRKFAGKWRYILKNKEYILIQSLEDLNKRYIYNLQLDTYCNSPIGSLKTSSIINENYIVFGGKLFHANCSMDSFKTFDNYSFKRESVLCYNDEDHFRDSKQIQFNENVFKFPSSIDNADFINEKEDDNRIYVNTKGGRTYILDEFGTILLDKKGNYQNASLRNTVSNDSYFCISKEDSTFLFDDTLNCRFKGPFSRVTAIVSDKLFEVEKDLGLSTSLRYIVDVNSNILLGWDYKLFESPIRSKIIPIGDSTIVLSSLNHRLYYSLSGNLLYETKVNGNIEPFNQLRGVNNGIWIIDKEFIELFPEKFDPLSTFLINPKTKEFTNIDGETLLKFLNFSQLEGSQLIVFKLLNQKYIIIKS